MCETGGGRRTWLRGLEKVRKRWTIQAAARNLGLIMRSLFGVGTSRSLQGELGLAHGVCLALSIIVGNIESWLIQLLTNRPTKYSPQFSLALI